MVDVRQMRAREWHTQRVRLRGLGALAFFFEQGSGIRNISLPVWAQ